MLTCFDTIRPDNGNGKSNEQTLKELIEEELKDQLKEDKAVEMEYDAIADEQFWQNLLTGVVGGLLRKG